MILRRQLCGILMMVALILLRMVPASAAPTLTPAPLEKVIEQAKKEAKVTVYGSYRYEEGDEIHAVFNKRYPFIKFEHVSMGAGDVVTRILMETRSGTPGADVGMTGATTFYALSKEGCLREVDWATLGVHKTAINTPWAVNCATVTYVIAWNTKLVARSDAPKGWRDLLDRKWKGKIGQWLNPYAFAELVPTWGEVEVADYLKKFLQNDPVIIREGAEIPSRLAAGEFSVAIAIDQTLKGVVDKGAPIDWIWPDPIAVTPYTAAMPKLARNPNAGTLYCVWLASPEGAAAYEKATGRGNVFVTDSPIAQKTKGEKYSYWRTEGADQKTAVLRRFTKMIMP